LGWQYLGICLISLATLIMHFSVIMNPREVMFDEKYYVDDARRILNSLGSERTEHPPLGKLLVATGIRLFGDNPLGWRFFSIISGTIIVVLFYFICRRLRMPERTTLFATFLFALENMSFVQSGIVMLDVYALVLGMAAFLLYLHEMYPLSGLLVGLSTLAKLNGALALIAIILHWLIVRRTKKLSFSFSILLAPASFIVLLPLINFLISGQWVDPIEMTIKMWDITRSLTFTWITNETAAYPWSWIFTIRNVYYWVEPKYLGTVSYTIWALIIPATIYMIYRGNKGNGASIFGLVWFASLCLIWIPVVLITKRVTYPYYIYPALGAICIGVAQGLSHLLELGKTKWTGKLNGVIIGLIVAYFLGHIAVFVILSPVFTRW
jgi:dolichyl-phosphate-mannose-protein mannosyltransferase